MNQNELAVLENTVRDVVVRLLRERETAIQKPEPQNQKPLARILVAVCCGDCLNEQALSALEELRRANFGLIQPDESEFKKREAREKMVASVDGILLPAVGDDDAAKMANGIFDEPVARVALSAIATGKPLFAVLHSPYMKEIQTRAPQLSRVWDGHKRTLESFGFRFVEYSALPDSARALLAGSTPGGSTPALAGGNGAPMKTKVLITAREIEAAFQNGASLKLPPGAIVTPLARDRAKELNVKMN